MFAPTRFSLRVVPSASLSKAQQRDISRLQSESLRHDYPHIPEERRREFVEYSEATRKHPNKAVGGPTLRARQAYARAAAILVIDQHHDLIAQVAVADNASRPAPETMPRMPRLAMAVTGSALMWAKLHLAHGSLRGKSFAASRYLWFGYAALGESARQNIHQARGSDLTVVDHMLEAGMQGRLDEQPVSVYPYDEEADWKIGIHKAGLRPDLGYEDTAHPFGEEFPVVEAHWTYESVAGLKQAILDKRRAIDL